MLTSLQALLRLASLRWLGVFICALAVLLTAASTASALEPAQTKTRVWGFDFAEHNSSVLFRAASSGNHQGNWLARAEEASGSLLAARGAAAVLKASPKSLLFRQGAREMTSARVRDMAEDMMVNRFNWAPAGPIHVAERDGVRIILDGHHRAAAAIEAGIGVVPVRVHAVSNADWARYMGEVIEAGGL